MTVMRVKLGRDEVVSQLTHQEFVQRVRDAAGRTGLPIARGKGPHARLKLTAGPPLGEGFVSRSEYMDFEVVEPVTSREFTQRLATELPSGIDVIWAGRIVPRGPHLRAAVRAFIYEVHGELAPACAEAFMRASEWPAVRIRKERRKSIDLKQSVPRIIVKPGHAIVEIQVQQTGTPRIQEVLEAVFGVKPDELPQFTIERAAVRLAAPGE